MFTFLVYDTLRGKYLTVQGNQTSLRLCLMFCLFYLEGFAFLEILFLSIVIWSLYYCAMLLMNWSDEKMRQFSATKREWGIEKLLPLNTFSDASNGFLVDDCCVFGVDIFVMNCNVEKGEVFSLIKQPNNYKYTWKLDNFSKLLDCSFWECNSFRVENCWW